MKRVLSIVVPLAGVLLLAVAVSAWAGGDDRSGNSGKTLTVVEHATTDATTDTGDPGDTAGDVLTFANDVFNAGDTAKVGTDQGYCIRVVKGAAYECTWTTFLAGGQIVVAGPFLDAGNSTLAITGGTGRYRGARGTMDLRSLAGGTKFAFVFHIKG
jgi:allene oxide cyclase